MNTYRYHNLYSKPSSDSKTSIFSQNLAALESVPQWHSIGKVKVTLRSNKSESTCVNIKSDHLIVTTPYINNRESAFPLEANFQQIATNPKFQNVFQVCQVQPEIRLQFLYSRIQESKGEGGSRRPFMTQWRNNVIEMTVSWIVQFQSSRLHEKRTDNSHL